MARNPELLRADVRDELAKIARLERLFESAEPQLALPPEAVGDYDRGAIGYLLHNFYNGCENIFRAIAAYFENDLGQGAWHADLLRRMRLEVPGYRPAVIDDELFRLLEDFRGFRHVFRNAYSFELDWERERLVASRLRIGNSTTRDPIWPRSSPRAAHRASGFAAESGALGVGWDAPRDRRVGGA